MAYYLQWSYAGTVRSSNISGYSSATCNPSTGHVLYSGHAYLTPSSTSGSVITENGNSPIRTDARSGTLWQQYIGTVVYEPDPILPSYTLGAPTADGIRVSVDRGDYSYSWWRVFVRKSDETDAAFDEWYNRSSGFSADVSGLSPNTEYVINVGYNNTGIGGVTWIGAQTFRTAESTEKAYIYHNGDWVPATPYIYHNGWVPATPNIYSGGWK